MGTLGDSWALTRESFRVLFRFPALLGFTVLSALAVVGVLAIFTVPLVVWFLANPSGLLGFVHSNVGEALLIVLYIGLYVLLAFVGNFFVAALVGSAMMAFRGETPTIGKGLAFARQRWLRIFVWSVIAATVGLAIQLISSRVRGFGGLILRLAAGATWALATYFVIPVIVFEQQGPWASLKRSGSLFIQAFGKTLISNLFLGLVTLGFVLIGAIPFVIGVIGLLSGGFVVAAVGLIVVGLAIWVFAGILAGTLEGILKTALYRYATTGEITPGLVPAQYQVGIAGQY